MKKKKRLNPVALRSREMIMDSLLDLMQDRPFAEITIKEIMFRAHLVRRTFYGHFATKEDVLDAYMDELFADYAQRVATFKKLDTYILVKTLFEFCKQHQQYFRLMKKNDLFLRVGLLERYLLSMLAKFNLEFSRKLHVDTREYATAYFAGGFHNIISHWIDEGMKRPPEEMGTICVQLVGRNLI